MGSTKKKEKEFLEMLSRHQLSIYNICRMFAKTDKGYVSDLYNEVVLRLWEEFGRFGLSRFRKESSENTWVSQIAYNTVSTYNKKYAMKKTFITIDSELADFLVAVDQEQDTSELWERADCLDDVDRNILRHFFTGASYLQIAESIGMKESAVGTRMSRIVQKLKAYYSRNGEERNK